jgi:uncharacterized protein DUF1344
MKQAFAVLLALSITGAYVWAQMTPPASGQSGPQMQGAPSDSGLPQDKEVQGKIKDLDPSKKTLTLEDGTKLTIPEAVKVTPGALKKGAMVIATYEEKAGQKVVTSILVQPQSKS